MELGGSGEEDVIRRRKRNRKEKWEKQQVTSSLLPEWDSSNRTMNPKIMSKFSMPLLTYAAPGREHIQLAMSCASTCSKRKERVSREQDERESLTETSQLQGPSGPEGGGLTHTSNGSVRAVCSPRGIFQGSVPFGGPGPCSSCSVT